MQNHIRSNEYDVSKLKEEIKEIERWNKRTVRENKRRRRKNNEEYCPCFGIKNEKEPWTEVVVRTPINNKLWSINN